MGTIGPRMSLGLCEAEGKWDTFLLFRRREGKRVGVSSVEPCMARQFLLPFALLSVVPLTCALVFTLGGLGEGAGDEVLESPKAEPSASQNVSPAVDQS